MLSGALAARQRCYGAASLAQLGTNGCPLCVIYSLQQDEGACESIRMDLEHYERDVVRSDHTNGAGGRIDFFCSGQNLSAADECDIEDGYCGGGLNGHYSTIHCIESRTPAGTARFDPEGRPQVFSLSLEFAIAASKA